VDTVTKVILPLTTSHSQHPPYNVRLSPQTPNLSDATLSLVIVTGGLGSRSVSTNGRDKVDVKLYNLKLELKLITPLAKVILYMQCK
jgi:hypothetical protein